MWASIPAHFPVLSCPIPVFHDDLFGGTRISSAVHQGRGPWSAARRWTDFHSRRRPRGGLASGHVRVGDQGSLILANAARSDLRRPVSQGRLEAPPWSFIVKGPLLPEEAVADLREAARGRGNRALLPRAPRGALVGR